MFRSKEVKKQLEQAELYQNKNREYKNTLSNVEVNLVEMQIEIDQLHMSATKMDRGLTHVVDHTKDALEQGKDSEEILDKAKESLESSKHLAEAISQEYDAQKSFISQQKQNLTDLMEQSKHYTDLSKKSTDYLMKNGESLQAIYEQIVDLFDVVNTISNLSLQSAIDAGRLGDAGIPYVQVAEQIRQLASEFAGKTEAVRSDVRALTAVQQEQEENLHKFINLVKDNHKTLSKITTETAKQAEKESIVHEEQVHQFVAIEKDLAQVEEHLQGSSKSLEAVLEEMESIGAYYMEQQESAGKMDATMEEIKQSLSEVHEGNQMAQEKGGIDNVNEA